MFYKNLAILFSVFVSFCYVVGFVYDSSLLEEFGVNYYEMIGSPLDYLSIGGMYFFSLYAMNLTVAFFLVGCVSIAYYPVKRQVSKRWLDKMGGVNNLGVILLGFVPFVILFLALNVHSDSVEYAKKIKSQNKDMLCISESEKCLNGVVVKYRDSKVIFYDHEKNETRVYPDSRVSLVKHG